MIYFLLAKLNGPCQFKIIVVEILGSCVVKIVESARIWCWLYLNIIISRVDCVQSHITLQIIIQVWLRIYITDFIEYVIHRLLYIFIEVDLFLLRIYVKLCILSKWLIIIIRTAFNWTIQWIHQNLAASIYFQKYNRRYITSKHIITNTL